MGLRPIAISLFFLTLSIPSHQPPLPFQRNRRRTHFFTYSAHISLPLPKTPFTFMLGPSSASRGYYPLPLLLILYLLRLAIPLTYLLQERILGRKLCPFPYSTSSPNKAPPAGYPPGRKWAT